MSYLKSNIHVNALTPKGFLEVEGTHKIRKVISVPFCAQIFVLRSGFCG
jgi:hypothetical protein